MPFTIFPAADYYLLFYGLVIALSAATFLAGLRRDATPAPGTGTTSLGQIAQWIPAIAVLLLIALRPLHGAFVDMTTYARIYEFQAAGGQVFDFGDPVFNLFVRLTARLKAVEVFFILCALLYVIPVALTCRRWLGRNWALAFLAVATSFSFFAYGTNGIRNGLAASLFVLALSREKPIVRWTLLALAVGCHASMMLPLLAYVGSKMFRSVRPYVAIWLAALFITIGAGGYISDLLGSLPLMDGRSAYLTDQSLIAAGVQSGFRLDFVLYSAAGVIAGAFYFSRWPALDDRYRMLYKTYLLANSGWLLLIDAAYSNRFAYLSWFILDLVMVIPLLQVQVRKSGPLFVLLYCICNGLFAVALIS